MRRQIPGIIACFFIFAGSHLLAVEGWEQLKFGMSTEEAGEALGDPLLKNRGSGFELWIYDNGAEAVFYGGPLVAWTTPSTGKSTGQAVDIWQRKPGAEAPVFILPRVWPVLKRPVSRTNDGGNAGLGISQYRVRN